MGGGMMGGNYEDGTANAGNTSMGGSGWGGHHSSEWVGSGEGEGEHGGGTSGYTGNTSMSGSEWEDGGHHSGSMGDAGMCANGTNSSGWGWDDGETYGGMGGMGGGDQAGAVIHLLFENRQLMERSVTQNDDGTILATTTSPDASVASLLQTHVQTMRTRLEDNRVLRQCDPFFVELFESHDEYSASVTNITEGVRVLLSAYTPCGQALIEGHTAIVSKFVETGMTEAMRVHPVPPACTDETTSSTASAAANSDTPPSSLSAESTSSACSTNRLLLVTLGFAAASALLSMGL